MNNKGTAVKEAGVRQFHRTDDLDIMERERRKGSTFSLSLHAYVSGYQEKEQRQHVVLALNSPCLVLGMKSPQLIQRQLKCKNGKRVRDEFPHSSQPQKCIVVNFSLKKKDVLYFLNY